MTELSVGPRMGEAETGRRQAQPYPTENKHGACK